MVKIQIDGQTHEIAEGKNLLETCLSFGIDLPYFCWHPALGSVGACRQCAVKQFKDEKDTHGKIVMSCLTPATEGARISVIDPDAKAFRASVIEWLMVNHPHDCPICDEGGECHLQDMTVMTGHTYRRYRFKKRTFRNQDLGPLVNHEMNRCIACYRCVRFYREYAGGHDLNVFSTHDDVYFGRHESGTLENEFSGNLVEVCPTGVFTDKTFKSHYTRKWDLQTAPSICTHCSLGCNIIPGERYGTLRRIRNRYHEDINGYFICDRGRFGYEFVNSERRVRELWFRDKRENPIEKVAKTSAIERLGQVLRSPDGLSRTIGIGSPRASIEANFALRTLVGVESFYSGLSEAESELVSTALDILKRGPVASATLREIENADAVLVLGEDLTNTAPRLALAVRQAIRNRPMEVSRALKIQDWDDKSVREAIQNEKGPLFVAVPHLTKLDEIATKTHHAAPDEIARLGFAIAHAIDPSFPEVQGLPADTAELATRIAHSLAQAKHPAVVSGTGIRSKAVLEAAANVAWALHRKNPNVRISFAFSEANSFGSGLLDGKSLSSAFNRMKSGAIDTIIVLENDLFRRADSDTVKAFLAKAKRMVVIDHTATAMIPRADVILPSTTFSESDGTLINHEGRAQRFYQVFVPKRETEDVPIQEGWRWLRDLMIAAGRTEFVGWKILDDVSASLVQALPALRGLSDAAPPAQFRAIGNGGTKIPRQPHRYSGRTAVSANVTIQEPEPPQDPATPFSFSMEGFQGEPPAPLITRYWAPGWNSVQALNKFQTEVGGSLRSGSSGKRLIEPASLECDVMFHGVPSAFTLKPDHWLMIPIHHIFGSEELSQRAPGIAKLAPRPYVAIGETDATRLDIKNGDLVALTIGSGTTFSLSARLEATLPQGIVGVPTGLTDLDGLDVGIPAWCEISNPRLAGAA